MSPQQYKIHKQIYTENVKKRKKKTKLIKFFFCFLGYLKCVIKESLSPNLNTFTNLSFLLKALNFRFSFKVKSIRILSRTYLNNILVPYNSVHPLWVIYSMSP